MGFFAVVSITSVLRKLFHGVVVCEDIAVNASQKRNGNFENRNKEVIGRFANGSAAAHERKRMVAQEQLLVRRIPKCKCQLVHEQRTMSLANALVVEHAIRTRIMR